MRKGAGRLLPASFVATAVALVAALLLQPAGAAEDGRREHRRSEQSQSDRSDSAGRNRQVQSGAQSPAMSVREPARAMAAVSMDQVIAQVERQYRARVVRADKQTINGRVIYVLRLLSEEGRVWTVRVDAETGRVI